MSESIETPERVDVSGASSAKDAAETVHEALQEWAEFYGWNSDPVLLYGPEETQEKRDMRTDNDVWTVAWEGGPFEWAPALTGGEWIGWNEFPGHGGDPEVTGLLDSREFGVECYYSFDIQFYEK